MKFKWLPALLALASLNVYAKLSCVNDLNPNVAATLPDRNSNKFIATRHWIFSAPADMKEHLQDLAEVQNLAFAHGYKWDELDASQRMDWTTQFMLSRFSQWQDARPGQIQLAQTLELQKIRASRDEVIQPWTRERLERLSEANLKRMLAVVAKKFPLEGRYLHNTAVQKRITDLLDSLRFAFIRPRNAMLSNTYHEPVVSTVELQKLGVSLAEDEFYSHLIGGSATVGFHINVTVNDAKLKRNDLLGSADHDLVLKDDFAAENGFVIPRFLNAEQLIAFFAFWDPDALTALNTAHHYASSVDGMLKYFASTAEDSLGNQAVYKSLSQLRIRLSDYVLTAEDAEIFLSTSLEYWINHVIEKDLGQLEKIENLARVGYWSSADVVFKERLYEALKVPGGFSLRIPMVVKAQDYLILNRDTMKLSSPLP